MKKNISKILMLLITLSFVIGLVACGKSEGDKEKKTTAKTEPVYKVSVEEIDPNIYPEDYPLIAFSDFETAFNKLKDANMNAEIKNYQDVADIMGVDGAYYENCDLKYGEDLYKYYGWYADNGANVLITFKSKGDKLEYFAYTSNGIN